MRNSLFSILYSKRSGYVAIVSALVLTAVVGAVVFVSTANVFFGRQNTGIFKAKKNTRYLAESCLEHARLQLADNSAYAGGENITVGSSTCAVVSITASGTQKVIRGQGTSTDSATNLELLVDGVSLTRVSLEEKQNF